MAQKAEEFKEAGSKIYQNSWVRIVCDLSASEEVPNEARSDSRMKITQEVREYAAKGMSEKAGEFKKTGSEIYQKSWLI